MKKIDSMKKETETKSIWLNIKSSIWIANLGLTIIVAILILRYLHTDFPHKNHIFSRSLCVRACVSPSLSCYSN